MSSGLFHFLGYINSLSNLSDYLVDFQRKGKSQNCWQNLLRGGEELLRNLGKQSSRYIELLLGIRLICWFHHTGQDGWVRGGSLGDYGGLLKITR